MTVSKTDMLKKEISMKKYIDIWRKYMGISIPLSLWTISLIVLWTIELIEGYLVHPYMNFLILYTFYGTPLFLIIMIFVYRKFYKKHS